MIEIAIPRDLATEIKLSASSHEGAPIAHVKLEPPIVVRVLI